ncbi:hypothetical protein, partial [Clostridium perfringens]
MVGDEIASPAVDRDAGFAARLGDATVPRGDGGDAHTFRAESARPEQHEPGRLHDTEHFGR